MAETMGDWAFSSLNSGARALTVVGAGVRAGLKDESEISIFYNNLMRYIGGEGGIRTPDTVARMPHFECGAFDHSATSPN
jgi:hypothetical protein